MNNWAQSLLPTFVPLFIAIDALGNVPFFMSLTEGTSPAEQHKTAHIAVGTAGALGIGFLFFGRFILSLMGISIGSFAIAGGIVLLVLSVRYLTTGRMVDLIKEEMIAVVPIGTPLTVGPATITTLLLLTSEFPLAVVLLSFILNLLISWGAFMLSDKITKVMGQGGLKAVSKVFSLLLAAIAVTMIIRGLNLIGILNTPNLIFK